MPPHLGPHISYFNKNMGGYIYITILGFSSPGNQNDFFLRDRKSVCSRIPSIVPGSFKALVLGLDWSFHPSFFLEADEQMPHYISLVKAGPSPAPPQSQEEGIAMMERSITIHPVRLDQG